MKEVNKCSKYNAGGKARWDCTKLLESQQKIKGITYNFSSNLTTIASLLIFIIRTLFLSKKDKLIVQTQFRGYRHILRYLYFLGNKKKIGLIFIVHDLEGLRTFNENINKAEMRCSLSY